MREFCAGLTPPVVVGIEATGSMGWFLRLPQTVFISTYRPGTSITLRPEWSE